MFLRKKKIYSMSLAISCFATTACQESFETREQHSAEQVLVPHTTQDQEPLYESDIPDEEYNDLVFAFAEIEEESETAAFNLLGKEKFVPQDRDAWSRMMAAKGETLLEKIYALPEAEYQKLRNPRAFVEFARREAGVDFTSDISQHVKTSKGKAVNYSSDLRLEYLTAITALTHAIHSHGGVEASSGAYGVTEPEGQRIKSLFFRYGAYAQSGDESLVASLADDQLSDHIAVNSMRSGRLNPFAYNRTPDGKSSHLKDSRLDRQQLGIDMRLDPKRKSLDLLPVKGKSHLLMGDWTPSSDSPRQSYFKFEKIGTGTIKDTIKHGLELFKKITKGGTASSRREDELPEHMGAILVRYGYDKKSKQPISLFLEDQKRQDPFRHANLLYMLYQAQNDDQLSSGGYDGDVQMRAGKEIQVDYRRHANLYKGRARKFYNVGLGLPEEGPEPLSPPPYRPLTRPPQARPVQAEVLQDDMDEAPDFRPVRPIGSTGAIDP